MPAGGSLAGAPPVSVVIPVLDDAAALTVLLDRLNDYPSLEIIVVDGGSRDGSDAVAASRGATVVGAPRGRGQQLAAGIGAARAPWLWLLHADSAPSPDAVDHLLQRSAEAPGWGRFAVQMDGGGLMKTVAYIMNLRSRLTSICTGDQGLFVHRRLLDAGGGMPEQALMEDIELTRRLKRLRPPDCRPEPIAASPRRWHEHGVVRTVLSMWRFRLRYWLGADPEQLAREYYRR